MSDDADSDFVETLKMVDLWSAVLQQAVDEFVYLVGRERAAANGIRTELREQLAKAREWMFEDDEVRVGSYMWICTVIQADPFGFRNRVMSLTNQRHPV